MQTLKDIVAYICQVYPKPDDLSRARLTKLVYLADWKSAIDHERTMTGISWYFDNYGPFVWDVWKAAESAPDIFIIERQTTPFGDPKDVLKLRTGVRVGGVPNRQQGILAAVIDATKDLSWQQFIRLVYSTYPVLSSERYSGLDLVAKAREYKQQREAQAGVS